MSLAAVVQRAGGLDGKERNEDEVLISSSAENKPTPGKTDS